MAFAALTPRLLENRRLLGAMLRQPQSSLTPFERSLRAVLLTLASREAEMRARQLISGPFKGKPLFVIKPSGNGCNYRCVYCYNHDQLGQIRSMDLESLKRIYQGIQSVYSSSFSIIWHGGEPLLAGKRFFREALALQEEVFGTQVNNSVQTNGSLLDKEWVEIFKQRNVSVGVSLDGEEDTNNRTRRKAGGQGGYADTLRGIRLAVQAGIEVGVISVITRGHRDGSRHYRFMRDIGVSVCTINPATQPADLRPSPEEQAAFVTEFIQAWAETGGVDPRPQILNCLSPLLVGKSFLAECLWNGTCHGILEVQPDGRVKTACDYNVDFSAFPQALLGNLLTDPPEEVLTGERIQQYFALSTAAPPACQGCALAWSCRGGCVFQRLEQFGSLAQPDPYCRYYQLVAAFLQELIDQVREFPLPVV